MHETILKHYREFSMYTNPGLYRDMLKNELPDNIRKAGLMVRENIIHRTTLDAGNLGTNADLKFGDMRQVPWYRQPEDDILVTASAMLAELCRRDERGFVMDRAPENKLVLTCRFVAILIASILKSKGIPARVRSGNAPYFDMGPLVGNVSADHWITQYWSDNQHRWITIDVDGSLSLNNTFDPYDMPDGKFDFPARAWLDIRANKVDPERFYNAKPERGAIVVLWSLFYDFHCLMNNEIIYTYGPVLGNYAKVQDIPRETMERIDHLAFLMQEPDDHFSELRQLWETDRELRLLTGGLLWRSYLRGLRLQ